LSCVVLPIASFLRQEKKEACFSCPSEAKSHKLTGLTRFYVICNTFLGIEGDNQTILVGENLTQNLSHFVCFCSVVSKKEERGKKERERERERRREEKRREEKIKEKRKKVLGKSSLWLSLL
jgi:hypothetical protein